MYVLVGAVKDAQGIKGEVYVRIFSGETSWLDSLENAAIRKPTSESRINLFTEVKPSQAVPSDDQFLFLKIERKRRHKDGVVFKFADINDRNRAESLKGFEFYLPEEMLISKPGESLYLREVFGFLVEDKFLGELGPVEGFTSNGPQDLLIIKIQGKEGLIPFIKPFIDRIDFKSRKISMTLPEGLLSEQGIDL